MKATHKGTCQACGRLQKLPNGRLSNHGYTMEWGYFHGTCHGAGFLPLEKDRRVCDETIKGLREYAERMRTMVPDRVEIQISKIGGGPRRWPTFESFEDFNAALSKAYNGSWEGSKDFFRSGCKTPEDIYQIASERQMRANKNRADSAEHSADCLAKMAEEVHGKPLTRI